MYGRIVVFRILAKTNKLNMNKFFRQFYGYTDYSNNYKYKYERKGFLDKFPHIKVIRGVIVVRENDAEEIINFMNEYNAEVWSRSIALSDEDKKILCK